MAQQFTTTTGTPVHVTTNGGYVWTSAGCIGKITREPQGTWKAVATGTPKTAGENVAWGTRGEAIRFLINRFH